MRNFLLQVAGREGQNFLVRVVVIIENCIVLGFIENKTREFSSVQVYYWS